MIPRLPKGFTHPMRIGGGAFAAVYRARQATLDRWVAVKMIHERDRTRRKRLLGEATTQAGLRIDCIPQVFDAFEWGARVCIAMQWIKGIGLNTLLQDDLAVSHRLRLAEGVVGALASVHSRGYAHRDLKPANIMVCPANGIYLIDFGFTKHVVDGQQSMAGTVKGTPAYMAPELWSGRSDIDHMRADVFSAGKILREILGDHPSVELCTRMMAEDPSHRPASGVETLDLWRESAGSAEVTSSWDVVAGAPTARFLAPALLASARQLLFAKREEEAYWLLVECLEESPDNGEALELMSSFPRDRKGLRSRGNVVLTLGVATALALVTVSFMAGRGTSRRDTVARFGLSAGAVHDIRIGGASRQTGRGVSDVAFHGDSLASDLLSGILSVASCPATGALVVDGEAVAVETARTGLRLPSGLHLVVWRDTSGTTAWRERVALLPFQTKRFSVVPR